MPAKSVKHITAALIAVLMAACSVRPEGVPAPPCVADNECSDGQLCFAEGCSDPGKGVVAEITSGTSNGQWPQDIAIPDRTLGKGAGSVNSPGFSVNDQSFALPLPITIKGEFQQQRAANPNSTDLIIYSRPVVVRASGESVLIPGLARSFRQVFEKPERGYFEMILGSGKFTLTATPEDTSVPPVTVSNVSVNSVETPPSFPITFPAVEGSLAVSGRVLKRIDANVIPVVEDPLIGVRIDIQAFDASAKAAISQRFPVSSTGDFTMTLSPAALKLKEVLFVVSPRSTDDVLPVREFAISLPISRAIDLEFGDFGVSQDLSGSVTDSAGNPVAGAQVLIDGTLRPGAHFRSQLAVTKSDGTFSLAALPTTDTAQLSFVVVPPATSPAATTRAAVRLTASKDRLLPSPSKIVCRKRVIVSGSVVLATGEPADASLVRAIYQPNQSANSILGVDDVTVMPDAQGQFALALDDGVWRLEVERANSPLASRLIEVHSIDDKGDPVAQQQGPVIALSRGIKVSGQIKQMSLTGLATSQSAARIRFFRVGASSGKPVSILLGSAVTDSSGRYEVLLPAK
jgi:hypothetical protein